MLSRHNFNNFFDTDFDLFAPIHRRYHRNNNHHGGTVAKRESPSLNSPFAQSLTKFYDDGFDSFWFPNSWSSAAFKEAIDNNVEMKEEPDKYLINFKAGDPNKSEVKVDYLKKENQLVLSSISKQKEEKKEGERDSSSTYSRSFRSSISFEKAVDSQNIKADIDGENVLIIVPKVERDEENVVSIIPIESQSETEKNLIGENNSQKTT